MYTERTTLIAVGAVTTLLGGLVMFLRAYIWHIRKRKQGLDDIFMAAAWVFSIGFTCASFTAVGYGLGLNSSNVPPKSQEKAMQAIYAVELLYYLSIFCVKMSLMGLYLRISGQLRERFWKATMATTVILILQFVSTVLVAAFQCRPLARYWNSSIHGTCVDIGAFFYSTNAFTIASDVLILSLPLPLLWSMSKPKKEKLGLLAAFSLGFMSTVMSGIRLYSIRIYSSSTDPTRDAAPISTWSFIEINLGILCASGAVIKALLSQRRKTCNSHRSSIFVDARPWRPKSSFRVITTEEGSTYTGTSSRIGSATPSCTQVNEPTPTIWDGSGTLEMATPVHS